MSFPAFRRPVSVGLVSFVLTMLFSVSHIWIDIFLLFHS